MTTFTLRPLQDSIKKMRSVCSHNKEEIQKGILYSNGKLVATNTEISVIAASDTSMMPESFVIPVKAFDFILALSGDEVNLSADEKFRLTVTCGKAKGEFASFDPKAYILPQVSKASKQATVDAAELTTALNAVIYCIHEDASQEIMRGCSFKGESGLLTLSGVSNNQIATTKLPFKGDDFEIIVPKKALAELLKGRLDGSVVMMFDEKGVTFRTDESALYSRLIEGKFFDIRRMISFDGKKVSADRAQFLGVLGRVVSLGSDKPVILDFKADSLEVSVETEHSAYTETVEVCFADPVRIGFNPKLLKAGFEGMDSETVEITLTKANAPAILQTDHCTAVVLPVRI